MKNKKYYIKNNDIKLTPKNLERVVNFVSSQLEDEAKKLDAQYYQENKK